MTAHAFTPGPWRFGHYGDGERCWVGPDYDRPIVADVSRAVEADARLIAAAPELFEALRALLGPFPGAMHGARARRDAEDRARAVLAKAGGHAVQERRHPQPQWTAAVGQLAMPDAQRAAPKAPPAVPDTPGAGRIGTDRDRPIARRSAGGRPDIAHMTAGASRRSLAEVLPAEAG